VPDEGVVVFEDVQRDGMQEEANEQQAEDPEGNQDEDSDYNYHIDINDETTFSPHVPFTGFISDKLVNCTREYREAVWHIWTLYQRCTLPRTRRGLIQLRLMKTLVDL
jgi:hypothetical protein